MIEFVYPLLAWLLPLPLLVYLFVPPHRSTRPAIAVPFFDQLVNLSGETPHRGAQVSLRGRIRMLLLIVLWLCIVTALTKPQWLGPPVTREQSARDLMVAVDLSASMENQDFVDKQGQNVDRLTAVKSVLTDFIAARPHDRLGLIVFGDAPFLQTPFTQDHATWLTLLNETEIAMAGRSTALGDAIGLAIKHFESDKAGLSRKNRVLIVLTDGNDTGSSVPPIEAAKVAARFDVTIYPIAIGDPETTGEQALDSTTLQRVAQLTNGVFYQALDRKQLSAIYDQIATLEPQIFETLSYHPKVELHFYPLVLVALILLLLLALQSIGFWQQRLNNPPTKPPTDTHA